MFGLFKKDPVKKLEREYARRMEEAMSVQRSGDLKKYAVMIEEAESIAKQIAQMKNG
ncbi:MAG: Lacal_2735 family protein [Saprospiraceae bacterium]|nr:Lacal_2735 family protein [Saprospiraceae bacterium]